MPSHDPADFVKVFGAKLATHSRHVCAFLGAGTSRACGLPDVSQLQQRVLDRLEEESRIRFEEQLSDNRNLEEALSRLRRIAALLTADQNLDGLTATRATELDSSVCRAIIDELAVEHADKGPMLAFAAWAARAGTYYHSPVELFTVNYDLLCETALEQWKVPYFDGFIGTLKARFQTELVEATPAADAESVPAFFTRLWKLHGSVNWAWEEREIVRIGQPVTEGQPAAIYPSDTKYEESRRVPFVVLHDRFRRALNQPETLLIVAGYSFGDQHLNELIFDAAARHERSEIVAFCYSEIPEVLAARTRTTPNLQVTAPDGAIIAGDHREWAPSDKTPNDVWGDGRFRLGDFRHLASHLARSFTHTLHRDTLAEILARLAQTDPSD